MNHSYFHSYANLKFPDVFTDKIDKLEQNHMKLKSALRTIYRRIDKLKKIIKK